MFPSVIPQRDPKLTGMVLAWKNTSFVGDSVGPILESETKGIEYDLLDKLNYFQDIDHNLARAAEANDVGVGGEKASAKMRNFALKTTILKEDIEDEDDWFNQAALSLDVLSATLHLQREKLQATLLFAALDGAGRSVDPGNWGNLGSGFDDVFDQIKTRMQGSVFGYDSAICPEQVWWKLERHPALLGQFYEGSTFTQKILTQEQFKQLFGLKELIVPTARIAAVRRPVKVTDPATLNRVWGSHFTLFKKASGIPNRMDPGFYYQWRRRWVKGAVGQNMQVRTWEDPKRGIGGSYTAQQEYQGLHHVFPEAGFVFKNVLA